jgi:MFS family permease
VISETEPRDTEISPQDADARVQYENVIDRDFRRNAAVIMLYEGTWAVGLAFVVILVMIPSYLGQLGMPRSVIGFASAIGVLTVPLQLFSERLMGGVHRKRNIWLLSLICSVSFLFMGIAGCLLPADMNRLLASLFILTIAIFFVGNNILVPVYHGMLTDNCPLQRRGRLFGYRAVSLGVIGLICLLPAKWILQRFSPLESFHVAMLLAGVFYAISSFSPLFFRDHIDPRQPERSDHRQFKLMLREAALAIRELWNTPNYRVFIYFAAVLAGSASLGPFIITYARDILSPDGVAPQWFQMIYFCFSIANGVFIGLFADRWGYKATMAVQALAGAATFVLAQTAVDIPMAIAAYGLLISVVQGMPAVFCNLSVELMPKIATAHLVASANVICLPVTVLLPWLAGIAIDLTRHAGAGLWGYQIVFAVGATLAVVALLGVVLLVQEPRTGRIYIIKVLQRG